MVHVSSAPWRRFLGSWQLAAIALQLLDIDPGLGGIVLRCRAGPVRNAFIGLTDPAARQIHPNIGDDTLYGGVDLMATLNAGGLVQRAGLLETPGPLLLTMAERAGERLAARLALCLDQDKGHTLIALDEGAEPDETVNPKLSERLAFHCDLSDVTLRDIQYLPQLSPKLPLGMVTHAPEILDQITTIAAQLGIDSLRAPIFALRAARANAANADRHEVTDEDIELACALTFAHRATRVPEAPPPEDQAPAPEREESNQSSDIFDLPDEILLDAVKAMLPENLLDQLQARKARQGRGNGSGAARKGNRRGRPLPSRPGKVTDQARIDLLGTLRAAAPWQKIRRREAQRDGLLIRSRDIHVKRFEENSDRLLIFAVDASGSSALARLAEAKGAIELLLAQAYARRDHVALVAFRGTGAELLLPPTRSLVQTKRRLAGLPGGGGTPLAAGMLAGLKEAQQAARRGLTPTIAILTDGRANIALDGSADRKQAAADAQQIAKLLRSQGTEALVIDTGNRPEPSLRNLAQVLDASYLPLPRADAQRLSASVAAVLNA